MLVVRDTRSSDEKKFWSKVFVFKLDFLVAICDKELLGKKIKLEKDFEIEIKKQFYGEKLINEEEALELLRKATIANLFGSKIVSLALKNDFITKENVITIDDVPHAQIVKLL